MGEEQPAVEPSTETATAERDEAELQPLQEAFRHILRRLVRRGQVEIDRVATTGRHRLELRQLNKDLDHFWVRLGKTAYHLVEAGEIDHPALQKAMTRIDELEAEIDERRRLGSPGPNS